MPDIDPKLLRATIGPVLPRRSHGFAVWAKAPLFRTFTPPLQAVLHA